MKLGACVPDGNVLDTGKAAIAKLRLTTPREEGTVNIGPESAVLVGFPIGGHPTKLILTRGQIRINSSARSPADAVHLHLLRMTVIPKTKGTLIQAQTWRSDEEAWIVVVHGSAEVRLGNQAPGLTLNAGQSTHVTSEQEALPHAVGLDSQEQASLAHDNDFQRSIADLLTIEITPEQLREKQKSEAANKAQPLPEEKMSSRFNPSPHAEQGMTLDTNVDMKEEEDVMLDSLTPPPAIPQPRITAQPLTEQKVFPAVVSETHSPPSPFQSPSQSAPHSEEEEKSTSSALEGLWSGRVDFGPAFYSDAAGIEVSGAAIRDFENLENGEKFSLGGGFGYSGASKNQLEVHNWKLFGLANYQHSFSKTISMIPELQLGVASENVQDSTTSFASGAAFYVSGRVLFEADIARLPRLHPGIALGFQDYVGGVGLSSAVLAISLRF